MNWYDQSGQPVTQVEKKGGGFTAPSIVHARKLGLIPDFDDVMAVYHGSHIAAERLMLSLDEAAQYPFAGDDKAAWRRSITARVREFIDTEGVINKEILGDVAVWCDKRKPSSVAGIELCEWIESFNPAKVRLDFRVQSWCSISPSFVMCGCDADAMTAFEGAGQNICIFITNGKQDTARKAATHARASAIRDTSIDSCEGITFVEANVINCETTITAFTEEDMQQGSDIAAAVRMLWSIEHNYIPTETSTCE